jgi:hypothetical protein
MKHFRDSYFLATIEESGELLISVFLRKCWSLHVERAGCAAYVFGRFEYSVYSCGHRLIVLLNAQFEHNQYLLLAGDREFVKPLKLSTCKW